MYIYTKLIRLDIYLKRTSGVLVIVRSFLLPKGSPDSKTDEYSVRAMLFIDALASVSSESATATRVAEQYVVRTHLRWPSCCKK